MMIKFLTALGLSLLTVAVLVGATTGEAGAASEGGLPAASASRTAVKSFPELSGFLLQQALDDWQAWRKRRESPLLQRALLSIDSSLSIDPGESEAWFVQGLIYSELKGDRLAQERALASFIRCIELAPGHGRGQFMTALKLQELGRFDLAVVQYRFLLEKDAALATGLTVSNLALAYLGAGRVDAGIAWFRERLKRYPGDADLHTALAVLLKAQGRLADAQKELFFVVTDVSAAKAKRDHAHQLLGRWSQEARP